MYEAIDFEALKRDMKGEADEGEQGKGGKGGKEGKRVKTDGVNNLLVSREYAVGTASMEEKPREPLPKVINAFYLYNYMQLLLDEGKEKTLFIIDLRTEGIYKKGHIKNSINIDDVNKINDVKNEVKTKKKAKIIFYDNEETQQLGNYNRLLNTHFANLKANYYFLKGGYKSFEKEYSFLCIKNNYDNTINVSSINIIPYINYPIHICENVYLGNIFHINNSIVNNFLRIKHVYDFTSSGFYIKKDDQLKYYRYNISKRMIENLNTLKQECINYYDLLDNHMLQCIIFSIVHNMKIDNMGTTMKQSLNEVTNAMTNGGHSAHHLCVKTNKEKNKLHMNNRESCNLRSSDIRHNVLIICNDGIKNQTNEKKNSISLVICMCYIMYRRKCSVNASIAYMLKICSNLGIHFQTLRHLHMFHQFLVDRNFNLELHVRSNNRALHRSDGSDGCDEGEGGGGGDVGDGGDGSGVPIDRKSHGKSLLAAGSCTNRYNTLLRPLEKEKDLLLQFFKSNNFRNIIKNFEINTTPIRLGDSRECVLCMYHEHLYEDIHIMEELVQNKEYCHYEYVMQSALHYVSKGNKRDTHSGEDSDNKVNYGEITNILEIFLQIMNDGDVENYSKMPYFSLFLLNLSKMLSKEGKSEPSEERDECNRRGDYMGEHENMKYNIFSLICNNTDVCIDYIINSDLTNIRQSEHTEEYEVTIKAEIQKLKERNINNHIYMTLLSLKYFLTSLYCFYVYPIILILEFTYIDKFYYLLRKIDRLADFYYSVFRVNINLFLSENYKAKMCPSDHLPLYFSDILRPFIIINNYCS
ncbi:mitogen-activated protein kinase phosphatase 1, putative [Plasmodium ovale]|uniref:Mitogen-activated protein kinase phosphatase 1, putative n=2 Tax=Plasmodium ovale TaxID=36330 RepID=A0A1D3U988_PLAOA|nr:mitogen-activated protein kinase phosphatase 1, putative (MKP1) [Plasmodium ovale curtisi]SBS97890.1 mitogen-activated protein kinase phosphatase 1, putative (MKP1) [Plasmodium ovale curtisi]SCQ16697.1 mitogen-activated protein kinase phosphatase 1, putative [Plasmodium ovale]